MITLSSASVRIDVMVHSLNETEAAVTRAMLSNYTAETLSSSMSITVQAMQPPEVISVLLRPPLLPPSSPVPPASPAPLPPQPALSWTPFFPNLPPNLPGSFDDQALNGQGVTGGTNYTLIIAVAIAGVVLIGIVPMVAIVYLCYRYRKQHAKQLEQPPPAVVGVAVGAHIPTAQSSPALSSTSNSTSELIGTPTVVGGRHHRTPSRVGPTLRRHQTPIATPLTIDLDFSEPGTDQIGSDNDGAALRRVQERVERARIRRRNVMERVERARAQRRENPGSSQPFPRLDYDLSSPTRLPAQFVRPAATPSSAASSANRSLSRTRALLDSPSSEPPETQAVPKQWPLASRARNFYLADTSMLGPPPPKDPSPSDVLPPSSDVQSAVQQWPPVVPPPPTPPPGSGRKSPAELKNQILERFRRTSPPMGQAQQPPSSWESSLPSPHSPAPRTPPPLQHLSSPERLTLKYVHNSPSAKHSLLLPLKSPFLQRQSVLDVDLQPDVSTSHAPNAATYMDVLTGNESPDVRQNWCNLHDVVDSTSRQMPISMASSTMPISMALSTMPISMASSTIYPLPSTMPAMDSPYPALSWLQEQERVANDVHSPTTDGEEDEDADENDLAF